MEYKNLSYLIGKDITIASDHRAQSVKADEVYEPVRVEVVNEYEKTLLVRKYFPYGSYLRMLNKNSMFCGDVKVYFRGNELTGKEVFE